MTSILNDEKIKADIDDFVTQVPDILSKNPLTADLAGLLKDLAKDSETPFTLAVIGQMRIGKSSLINGLIGKKSAVVGVNETTATVNYFKYGTGEITEKFRVHWKNRHYEELPCSDIEQWIGDSNHAADTRYLEFFDDAEFFKNIHLVDTPGTRSVLKSHEDVIQGFLDEKMAEKKEQETLQHGGRADAIMYVTGAVANVKAEEMLRDFQDKTRLPGSSPYNSVAVLHKWEVLEVDRPYDEAFKKAAFMEKQFKQYVSKVIPVSGPLALAAKTLSLSFWNGVITLVQTTDQQRLRKNLERGDSRFKKNIENGEALLEQSKLPWACFRTLIRFAMQEKIDDGKTLCDEIFRISGIQALMDFLQARFIKRSGLIKRLTTLTKSLDPCKIAQLRIKADIEKKEKLLCSAEQSLSILNNYITKESEFLKPVSQFINLAKEPFLKELEQNRKTQVDLGNKTVTIEADFNQMVGDMKTVDLLEEYAEMFSENEKVELNYICGGHGFSVLERTQFYSKEPSQAFERVLGRLEFWSNRQITAPSKLRPLFDHIESRLEEFADELETMGEENE